MVCGSPDRKRRPFLLFAIVTSVLAVSSGAAEDTLDPGVYYERYPLHDPGPVVIVANKSKTGRHHVTNDGDGRFFFGNCTDPTIQDFPPDMFTQEQRQKGNAYLNF